jgi:hypothetical protein
MTRAPWEVTTLVSCLPVLVLGLGSALAHMLRSDASAADAAVRAGTQTSAAQPTLEATGQYPPDQTGNSQTNPIEDVTPTPPSAVPAAPWTQPCNAAGQRRADRNRAVYLARQAQARPPARMRLPDAYTAAASVIASGQRVSRRSLRSAGLHGSNADLGMLARLARGNPYSDESRAAP